MYQALLRRDAGFDGLFLVAVKTTGIFCRPTCTARKPRAQNVEFFASAKDCLLAGYRPCKRCRPMDKTGKPPQWVAQLMSAIEREPTRRIASSDLRELDIEPSRARRYFVQHYGMTFHAYHRARRMGQALKQVRNGGDVNGAGLRHGYESASGFRDAFSKTFGGPPARLRNVSCLLARWLDTPLGPMLALASDEGLCLLEFVDRRMLQTQLAVVRRRFAEPIVPGNNVHLDQIADELSRYFAGDLRQFKTPYVLRGTPFQLKIWRRLMQIPYGQTTSYSQMASDIGVHDAQRAVGRANGDNRLAIIIPCHRVVRANGTLCGYGGGLWRKKWLLEHEKSAFLH
jgi:AraC family transcriptional regulator of adaptative response/methylated-DNA-[protein]-cysteine methyltransferase